MQTAKFNFIEKREKKEAFLSLVRIKNTKKLNID